MRKLFLSLVTALLMLLTSYNAHSQVKLFGASIGFDNGTGESSLYEIDPATGIATLIGPIGFDNVTGMVQLNDGRVVASARGDALYNFVTTAILIEIDLLTGAGTLIGVIDSNAIGGDCGRMPDLTYDPLTGTLYGYSDNCGMTEGLWQIDPNTGSGTAIGISGFGDGGNGLAYHAASDRMFATPIDANGLVLMNKSTGLGTVIPASAGNVPTIINALDFSPVTGELFGSHKTGGGSTNLIRLDTATGLATTVGQTIAGLDALGFASLSVRAAFSSDVQQGPAPLTVNFTDLSNATDSTTLISWAWDFDGDGNTDTTIQNPSYTYDTLGSYSVTLIVSDGIDNDTTTVIDYITVVEPPDISLSGNSLSFDIKAGDSVSTSVVIRNFGSSDLNWSIAAVDTSGTIQNLQNAVGFDPAAAATPAGDSTTVQIVLRGNLIPDSYNFLLRVSSDDPDEPESDVSVALTIRPAANFEADVTSGFAPLQVNFNNTSSINLQLATWSWDLDGDGLEDSDEQNPSFTYQDSGLYTVTLAISDGTDTDTLTIVDYIFVELPPILGFSPSGFSATIPSLDSSMQTLTVSNTGIADLQWSIYPVDTSSMQMDITDVVVPSVMSGSVPSGTDVDIEILLRAKLRPGTYNFILDLISNDPLSVQNDIPISMTILAPQILTVDSIRRNLTPGDSVDHTITISNLGDGHLQYRVFVNFNQEDESAIDLYSVTSEEEYLRRVSPDSATTLSMIPITLPGYTVEGATGLATDPSGQLWAILKVYEESGRELVFFPDPSTGVAVSVGNTGMRFAGIAFDNMGDLYAVTGDGGQQPETLFRVNTSDASSVQVLELGRGDDGEALGYNPDDGLMYHASGHDGVEEDTTGNSGVIFEAIDLVNLTITDVPIDTTPLIDEEAQALTYWKAAGAFLWKQDHGTGPLYMVTSGGIVTYIGDMDHQAKGLAFAPQSGPQFMSALQPQGLITANSSGQITIRFKADTLAIGNYRGNVILTSNDPENPLTIIPVTLGVQADVTPPNASLNFFQDNLLTQYVNIVSVVSESSPVLPSVDIIRPDQTTEKVTMNVVDVTNHVYNKAYKLEDSGNYTFTVRAADASFNFTDETRMLSAALTKKDLQAEIVGPDDVVTLSIEANSLEDDMMMTISGQPGSIFQDDKLIALSDLYKIGPAAVTLKRQGTLTVDLSLLDTRGLDSEHFVLMRKVPSGFEYVPATISVENSTATARIGTFGEYQLYYNPDVLSDGSQAVPTEFALFQNFPNPFNPTTTIRYDLPEKSKVFLGIYNILGQRITTLISNKEETAGRKQVVWDGRNAFGSQVATGIYIYRLRAGKFTKVQKMLLIK